VPTETLAVLRRALWDDRRVTIAYRDRSGKRTSRQIDPLGLVSKSGVWYLVAGDGEDYRSFRADRIAAAEPAAEHFERPRDFDLDAYWSQSSQRVEGLRERYPVTVRARRDALDTLTAYWQPARVDDDGAHCVVRFDFPGRAPAIQQLLAWSDVATIVEPQAAITAVVELAQATLARYG